ncbi:MAG: hypothetical protein WBC73_22105 [Phormidesmis sp.]
MKGFRSYVSAFFAGLRPVAIALACALLVFSSAAPALAFGGSSSRAEKGLEQLNTVQDKSEEAISGPTSKEKDIQNSEEGLNGVQGDANRQDMKSPEGSGGVSTIEENIKEALEGVTP